MVCVKVHFKSRDQSLKKIQTNEIQLQNRFTKTIGNRCFLSLVLSLTLNVDYISRDGKIYTCKECEYTSAELTNIR